MKRYHISSKTGLPNICRAKTPETCRAEPAFNEDDTPHFTDKASAHKYIEKQLEKDHNVLRGEKVKDLSQKEIAKRNDEDFQELNDFLTNTMVPAEGESIYSFSSGVEDVPEFLNKHFPDFKVSSIVEKIDYNNEYLLEKNDNYYILTTHGGEYSNHTMLTFDKVEKVKVDQIDTVAQLVRKKDKVSDKEIVEVFEEFTKEYKILERIEHPLSEKPHLSSVYINSGMDVLERSDGTKVYGFSVEAEGDSSLFYHSDPVHTGIGLYENDERQNGRMNDVGFVLYDTRSEKGLMMIYRDGSEGGEGAYSFEYDTKNRTFQYASDENHYQNIYILNGTGKTVEAAYYKIKKD